ncbi:hypothetical protein ACRAWG_28725 [Methylobacterium sp. P31]
MAGPLTRQATYVALACADLEEPSEFLTRLGVEQAGAEGIGIALRARHARDVIAATFKVEAAEVPTGYLRALARIEEISAKRPGFDPFEDSTSYRALWEIMAHDRHGRQANALRYVRCLRSSVVDAVLTLDPILIWPEVLGVTGTPQRVAAANALLDLIRACHTTIDDRDLVSAMRKSLQGVGVLEVFARKALDRADRLPAPLPAAQGIRPLTTAADYKDLARRLQNCAGMKLGEVALGLLAVVEVTHRAENGSEMVLAASLTPIADGRWMVSEVGGVKNRKPPREVLRSVLRRLQELGAIIPGPAVSSYYRKDLADMLGIYRFAELEDALHPHAVGEADKALEALEANMEEAA